MDMTRGAQRLLFQAGLGADLNDALPLTRRALWPPSTHLQTIYRAASCRCPLVLHACQHAGQHAGHLPGRRFAAAAYDAAATPLVARPAVGRSGQKPVPAARDWPPPADGTACAARGLRSSSPDPPLLPVLSLLARCRLLKPDAVVRRSLFCCLRTLMSLSLFALLWSFSLSR